MNDILDILAGGATRDEILADSPYLEDEDITGALEFASRAGRVLANMDPTGGVGQDCVLGDMFDGVDG